MGDSSEIGGDGYSHPLSKREVRLLSEWERERRSVITLAHIRERVGANAAADVARALVRKQALQRLGRGRYLARPFRALNRPTVTSTPVAAEALLAGERHYLGGLWALSFHGLTEQRYASVVDAFVTRRRASRKLGAGTVRFHVLSARLLGYGVTTALVEGLTLHLSDAERTLLDAFDHPRLFGGLAQVLTLARSNLHRLDADRAIAYAVAGSKPSTCQRIGVLLERERVSRRALAKLRAKAGTTRSLLSLDPGAGRTGPVNRTWNVVENDR